MNRGTSEAPTAAAHLGMVAAFHREVAPLLRSHRPVERLAENKWRFFLRGGPVVLAISGIGSENSYNAARELLRNIPLRALISVGFAGGLNETAFNGALVIADEVIEEATGNRYYCELEIRAYDTARRGRLVSAGAVVRSAEQKRLLGRKWGAVAVDMESAGVARAAQEAGLPFAAVKAITDAADQSIAIDFQRCRSDDGRLSSWRILREGMASPGGFRDLWRLAASSRRAAGTLAMALGEAQGTRVAS